ncbi:MAG TPA: Sir2 family NAD-dependent protein deacetylase [Flavobacteriales bacterium]|nr:NAD-dependent deacylase [Flavobacteriales bacterium]MCC6400744.1 NAD-dependent deacylase [Flavobacteriales bacterium]HQW85704.1 Sir2 family NAD-dependent protein deacetylase [Flavobacteriales bacterium]
MDRERVVVLTGAGVSAESGLRTFRDGDGLWEEHRVEDVATPEAWERDPELVLRFYDQRRAQVIAAGPNAAHTAIARLETAHEVDVVTQNIDDLHERAGSTRVMHLHGEILLARSTADPRLITPVNGPTLRLGDRCALGSQLRPHIVWFGEAVPLIAEAAALVARADRLIIVGTSLQVYPAAGLVHALPPGRPIHLIDPSDVPLRSASVEHIKQKASIGMPMLASRLLGEA